MPKRHALAVHLWTNENECNHMYAHWVSAARNAWLLHAHVILACACRDAHGGAERAALMKSAMHSMKEAGVDEEVAQKVCLLDKYSSPKPRTIVNCACVRACVRVFYGVRAESVVDVKRGDGYLWLAWSSLWYSPISQQFLCILPCLHKVSVEDFAFWDLC